VFYFTIKYGGYFISRVNFMVGNTPKVSEPLYILL